MRAQIYFIQFQHQSPVTSNLLLEKKEKEMVLFQASAILLVIIATCADESPEFAQYLINMPGNATEHGRAGRAPGSTRRNRHKSVIACHVQISGLERGGLSAFSIESIPVDKCTHVVYSYVGLNPDTGEIALQPHKYGSDVDYMRRLHCMKALNPHLDLILSFGDGTSSKDLVSMMSDDKKVKAFANSAVLWIMRFGFDGLNLHWEGPGSNLCQPHVDKLYNLLEKLKRSFKSHEILLTVQIPLCRTTCLGDLNKAKLASLVDLLFLMAYNYEGVDYRKTNIHTALYSADNKFAQKQNTELCAGAWVDDGVPRSKMILGIAFFGKSFTLYSAGNTAVGAPVDTVNVHGSPGYLTKKKGFLSYIEMCRNVKYWGWRREWDASSATPYAYDQLQWVSFEDKDGVYQKAKWFRNNNLGGVFMWSLDLDDYSGQCENTFELLKTVYNVLSDYKAPSGLGRRCSMPHYQVKVSCKDDNTPHQNDYTDCTRYFQCVNGKNELYTCKDGKVWNDQKGECVPPEQSERPECKERKKN